LGFIETQAYNFAGLMLVPQVDLRRAFEAAADEAAETGVDASNCTSAERKIIADKIGRDTFNVSGDVIAKRLKLDGIW
jgi:hypothetical protein